MQIEAETSITSEKPAVAQTPSTANYQNVEEGVQETRNSVQSSDPVKTKKYKKLDLLSITESLGFQTHRKQGRNTWTKEEDDELRRLIHEALKKIDYPNGIDDIKTVQQSAFAVRKLRWDLLAAEFTTSLRNSKDLRKRWTGSLDPNLKKGKWTPDEDAKLLQAYEKHGPHWLSVSLEMTGRTEDQCAKRYMEVLGPSSQGRLREWTEEEDLQLISKVKAYGTKWRKISSEMESRPSLTCRNRWRKIITSVVRGRASDNVIKAVQENKDLDLRVNYANIEKEEETIDGIRRKGARNSNPQCSIGGRGINSRNGDLEIGRPNIKSSFFSSDDMPSAQLQDIRADGSTLDANSNNTDYANDSSDNRNQGDHFSLQNGNSDGSISRSRTPTENSNQDKQRDTDDGNRRTHVQWKFTLKDKDGLSLTNGTISNLDLVKALIEQARKYSVMVSIHQHIHHHYNSVHNSNHGGFPHVDSKMKDQSLPPSNDYKSAFDSLENDFLSKSPNYETFDAAYSPTNSNDPLTFKQARPRKNGNTPDPYGSANKPSPLGGYHSPSERSTISGSGSDALEVGPNRSTHFNYLPPTVRPQLESSDSVKVANMHKILSSGSHHHHHNSGKRRKVMENGSQISISKNHNPDSYAQSPKRNDRSQVITADDTMRQKSKHPPGHTPHSTVSTTEEEGIDFWESLRSLAGPHITKEEGSIEDELQEANYGILGGLVNKSVDSKGFEVGGKQHNDDGDSISEKPKGSEASSAVRNEELNNEEHEKTFSHINQNELGLPSNPS